MSKETSAYIAEKFKESYASLEKRLKLGENAAYVAFTTDIFVNTHTDQGKQKSCLLLDRFITLLLQLDNKETMPKQFTIDQLVSTYESAIDSSQIEGARVLDSLSSENDFMIKFQVM